ncbi:hypothetical protein EJ05DRAFT_504316 [Pseudovirgaria hyperparasitica]|uniref:Zn(2)-C6 fungal-type domain-containing protein n=1 Tax=Pseudovirgaria hyperparasitica TaxID=470096 RepID=A0A6A6VWP7_9PEZI|nr:uncharacterized protein EJ05DRAFT_504316 [Pseudovirgaria hyperparasitica]KAF2754216.1 hypothetical protein EJ05DRAFT_504316 [Pseudovirgaria hyperparasitica]
MLVGHYEASSVAEKPEVQLTCLQCQQRKRKCDKMTPCQTCVRSGTQCTPVSRTRLPRGRHALQRDGKDLRQRVARLEKLLMDQKDITHQSHPTPPSDSDDTASTERAQSVIDAKAEIAGIKDILHDLTVDEPDDPVQNAPDLYQQHSFDLLLYGDTSCFVQPDILNRPLVDMASALLDIYYHRVHPIFKPTHRDEIYNVVLNPHASKGTTSPRSEALAFAVMYTSVSSIDDEECFVWFKEDKLVLRRRYRLATEVYLSRAGLLATTDLMVLQAYIIYLVGYQIECGLRKAHSLLAIAVRIGQALALDTDEGDAHRMPYENEMRRRLWYSIGILDLRAAFGLGLHSALGGGALFISPPLHINDWDISPQDHIPPEPRRSFSDMTYCCATYEMLIHMRKVLHVPKDVDGRPVVQRDWQYRSAIPGECAAALTEKCSQFCDPNHAFQLLTKNACAGMSITLQLIARRPMHRIKGMVPPPDDDFDILEVARLILESNLLKADDARFKPWAWFAWPKWYALAVLLAELCQPRTNSGIERAWDVAERSFDLLGASDQDEILWDAMKKLMRKARVVRDASNAQESHAETTASPTANKELQSTITEQRYSHGDLTKLEDANIVGRSGNAMLH